MSGFKCDLRLLNKINFHHGNCDPSKLFTAAAPKRSCLLNVYSKW